MAEFEEKLNALLSDPNSMAQIMQLAQSLGGGSAPQQNAQGGFAPPPPPNGGYPPPPGQPQTGGPTAPPGGFPLGGSLLLFQGNPELYLVQAVSAADGGIQFIQI